MYGDQFGEFVSGYRGLKGTFPQVPSSGNLSQLQEEAKQKLQELTE